LNSSIAIRTEIRWHLERFAEPGPNGLVFTGPKGGTLRRSNFHKSVWSKARNGHAARLAG
jgi:hypothetical protein